MSFDVQFVRAWVGDINSAADRMLSTFEERHGYPPGVNHATPATHASDAAALENFGGELVVLYRGLAEANLPDVGNGYFVHPAETVVRAYEAAEPRAIDGPYSGEVLVFASDGGGTTFAIPVAGPTTIYRLPPGQIVGGLYTGRHIGRPGSYGPVATGVEDFLSQILSAVVAFANRGALMGP